MHTVEKFGDNFSSIIPKEMGGFFIFLQLGVKPWTYPHKTVDICG